MRICGSEIDAECVSSSTVAASSCIGLAGMFVDGADVECEEVKRKSVMEPTLDERHETVVVVVVVVGGDRELV